MFGDIVPNPFLNPHLNPQFNPYFTPPIGNPPLSHHVPYYMNWNYMMPKMNSISEHWEEGYETKNWGFGGQSKDSNSPGSNKINITFKTTSKVKTNIVADYGQTMRDIILLYLKKEGKENLFKRCSGIFFLYNAQMIDVFDETKVEEFFKDVSNPLIFVNEMKFVIGA